MMLDSIMIKDYLPDLRSQVIDGIGQGLEKLFEVHLRYQYAIDNLTNLYSKSDV